MRSTDEQITASLQRKHRAVTRRDIDIDSYRFATTIALVMIDTLYQNLNRITEPIFWKELQLETESYIVLTLHRPSNVDEEQSLIQLLMGIDKMAGDKKIIFPIHPRTKAILGERNLDVKNIFFVEPQGYLNFMFLIKNSFAVVTDSGGISEETTVLGIPCFTMRNNTERPETQTIGTNTLVGTSIESLEKHYKTFLESQGNAKKVPSIPELWDGKASERIIAIILQM